MTTPKPPRYGGAAGNAAVVLVSWLDSASLEPSGWKVADHVRVMTPDYCLSVGFLVHECDDHLVIAPHAAEHCVFGEICIPRSAVVAVRRWKARR